ncbi:DUF6928 family protein [Streptomyces roseoverticillatus]|uniref:Uncharacterized protein n=1 Tax=Streptomyces roseoverticillatus TaxID=66429 RepID=A0ABV3J4L5_9ACTN
MGSKAAMVVFTEAKPNRIFRNTSEINHTKSKHLAELTLGVASHEIDPIALDLAVWPDDGVTCAASFPKYEIVCSRELAQHKPSELTGQISRLAAGRNAYAVFMHSATDWTAFAVWSGGHLLRSLSVSPGSGVIEDVGDRYSFEAPFWRGQHQVQGGAPYALPFHPIDLGNEALREFFGFILEGQEDETCLDPEEVEIPAFRAALQP